MQSFIEWSVVVAFILFLLYTLWVIKGEKSQAMEFAKTYNFGPLIFSIPPWWGEDANNEKLIFSRHDTRYDWKATFSWLSSTLSLEDELQKQLKEKEIEMDPETITCLDHNVLMREENLKQSIESFLRVEGTATQAECDRLYYDACLVKLKNKDEILYCESKSSVLNGSLEGPFFEEVLAQLKMNESSIRD